MKGTPACIYTADGPVADVVDQPVGAYLANWIWAARSQQPYRIAPLAAFPPRVSGELLGSLSMGGTSSLDLSGRIETSAGQLTASLDAHGDAGALVSGAQGTARFELEGAGPVGCSRWPRARARSRDS